jgi:hypothetical protein
MTSHAFQPPVALDPLATDEDAQPKSVSLRFSMCTPVHMRAHSHVPPPACVATLHQVCPQVKYTITNGF